MQQALHAREVHRRARARPGRPAGARRSSPSRPRRATGSCCRAGRARCGPLHGPDARAQASQLEARLHGAGHLVDEALREAQGLLGAGPRTRSRRAPAFPPSRARGRNPPRSAAGPEAGGELAHGFPWDPRHIRRARPASSRVRNSDARAPARPPTPPRRRRRASRRRLPPRARRPGPAFRPRRRRAPPTGRPGRWPTPARERPRRARKKPRARRAGRSRGFARTQRALQARERLGEEGLALVGATAAARRDRRTAPARSSAPTVVSRAAVTPGPRARPLDRRGQRSRAPRSPARARRGRRERPGLARAARG